MYVQINQKTQARDRLFESPWRIRILKRQLNHMEMEKSTVEKTWSWDWRKQYTWDTGKDPSQYES